MQVEEDSGIVQSLLITTESPGSSHDAREGGEGEDTASRAGSIIGEVIKPKSKEGNL